MNSLAITVPTYNRSILLDFFLSTHAPIFQKYNVSIYVADNASNDDTENVCQRWASSYSVVRVHRFANHVQPDENFHRALSLPSEDFIWLMGDGYQVTESMLIKVLSLLGASAFGADHITTNLVSLSKQVEPIFFTDRAKLLRELPWLMTCLSCNIYSKRLIDSVNFTKFYDSYWLQLGIVLDYLERHETRFLFFPQVSVVTLKCPVFRKTGWGESYFKVCFDHFPALLSSLGPSYSVDEKTDISNCFYRNAPLFKLRHLLNIRSQGHLNRHELSVYRHRIKNFAPLPFYFLIMSLASLPRPLAFIAARVVDAIRRLNYRAQHRFGLWKEGY